MGDERVRINVRVELTDSEWMDLIAGDDSRPGSLGQCCANISSLRDRVIGIARDGGKVNNSVSLSRLREAIRWVMNGHEIDGIPALIKLRDQVEALSLVPSGNDI
jgi:hypothetical protein